MITALFIDGMCVVLHRATFISIAVHPSTMADNMKLAGLLAAIVAIDVVAILLSLL